MADDHSIATAGDDMDLPAHEETYADFLTILEITVLSLFCILLQLVLWGLKGHLAIAAIGFVLTGGAAWFGFATGLGWRAVLPVFLLLGLACIVL
jgi:Bacterial aa3 type cytochrome c oxidase subunit IV